MISVLMPTYNCAEYLACAINSILNQSFKDFEFLIIDDGSTDNCSEIVNSFNDYRIRYIKKQNTGLADSLNYGLRIAKYDLIARMDADDIALPYRFEFQLNYLSEHPNIDILSSWYAIFSKKKIDFIVQTPVDDYAIKKGLALYSYISHPSVFYQKKTILNAGGYREKVFEDYELWLRLMGKAIFGNVPKVLLFQRYRNDSLSRKDIKTKYLVHYYIQKPYYNNKFRQNFSISSLHEELIIKGWREYFYGCPKEARKHWKKIGFELFKNYRILLAFIFSYLPQNLFVKFKESRFRFKIEYILQYSSKKNHETREQLKKLIS